MPRATNDPLTPPKATTVAPPAAAAKAGGDAPQRSSAAAASGSGEVGYVHSQYEPSRQIVLEQHQRFQRNVLNARENASGSRAASNYQTPSYVARQKEYMQWFGAKSGFLRGVALREKKPLPFPVVTRSWAAVFLEEVYCNGFQFRTGKVAHKKIQGNILWWKTYYTSHCYDKILPDDTQRTFPRGKAQKKGSARAGATTGRQIALNWNQVDSMLKALEDLRIQQWNSSPDECQKYYNNPDMKKSLRGKGEKDARFKRIKVQIDKRNKQERDGREVEKFSDTIVDALTYSKHLKMLEWYMQRRNYSGALMAMNAAAKFTVALRPSDTGGVELSDLGTDISGKIFEMNHLDKNPVVGLINLGKHPKLKKYELGFYLPHKNDEANLFFYKGHYFFWRWTIARSPQPDFSNLDADDGGGGSSSSSSSAPTNGMLMFSTFSGYCTFVSFFTVLFEHHPHITHPQDVKSARQTHARALLGHDGTTRSYSRIAGGMAPSTLT